MNVKIGLSDDLEGCFKVRRSVFVDEQGVTEAEEVDGLDDTCLHVLATQDEAPAGTARIQIKGNTAKVGRVCVLSSQRGTGLGAAIMREVVDICKTKQAVSRVVLGSQIQAMGFYEKLGFRSFGPIYLDAKIEHRDMELNL
ncbi:MAG: GNAT family N-acetyltransferase [Lentilitoribacter sp.]